MSLKLFKISSSKPFGKLFEWSKLLSHFILQISNFPEDSQTFAYSTGRGVSVLVYLWSLVFIKGKKEMCIEWIRLKPKKSVEQAHPLSLMAKIDPLWMALS